MDGCVKVRENTGNDATGAKSQIIKPSARKHLCTEETINSKQPVDLPENRSSKQTPKASKQNAKTIKKFEN